MTSDVMDNETGRNSSAPTPHPTEDLRAEEPQPGSLRRCDDSSVQFSKDVPEARFHTLAMANLDELETIFTGILRELESFISYTIATVFVETDGQLRLLVMHNYTPSSPTTVPVEAVPLFQTMKQSKEPITIHNVLEEPRFHILWPELDQRAWMGIPLRVEDTVIGIVTFSSQRAGAFEARDAHLAKIFIDQAAYALEKASMAHALAAEKRNLELLYELSQSLVETLDPKQVAQRAIGLTTRALGARSGEIFIVEEPNADRLTLLAQSGEYFPEPAPAYTFLRIGQGLEGTVAATRQPIVAPDVLQEPRWIGDEAGNTGIQSAVAIPLLANDQLVGVLSLCSTVLSFFTPQDLPALQAVAAPIAMSLQNARLFAAERRRYQEAETLRSATSAIVLDLGLEQILQELLARLQEVVPLDSATIMLQEGESVRAVATLGLTDPHSTVGQYHSTENVLLARIKKESSAIFYEDVQEVEGFQGWGGTQTVHGWMAVPLRHHGRFIGYLTVDSERAGAYGEREASLAQAFANQATVTIVNAQLLQESQQRIAEMESLNNLTLSLRPVETRQGVMQVSLAYVLQTFGGDLVRLCMPAGNTNFLEIVQEAGSPLAKFPTRLHRQGSIFGHLLDTGQPHLAANLFQDTLAFPTALADWAATTYESASAIFAPLHTEDKIIGVIAVYRLDPEIQYTGNDLQLLSTIASIIGTTLHRSSVLETTEQRVTERTQELAEANERLQELDRLKSEFVANVSHELRTPLTNIRFYLDLLERGRAEKHGYYLSILHGETRRLNSLIESILDLSRFDAARVRSVFEVTAVDVGHLAHEVHLSHQAQANAKGIELTCVAPVTPLIIGADRNQIVQIISNLVANAINYTPAGGRVNLCVQPASNDGAELIVRDTGIGIHPKEMDHLFDRFYRSPRTVDLGISGTGLGLSIVKEIVDLHAGTITVASKIGEGSVFTVWLPNSSCLPAQESHS